MWKCLNNCNPDRFVVPLYNDNGSKYELGILVYPNGCVTNVYEDGIIGVSEDEQIKAEESECAICPKCGEEAKWKPSSEDCIS